MMDLVLVRHTFCSSVSSTVCIGGTHTLSHTHVFTYCCTGWQFFFFLLLHASDWLSWICFHAMFVLMSSGKVL